jgi:hypothetical protein
MGVIAVSGIVLSLAGQGSAPVTSQWTATSRHRAEDQVATKLELIRAASGLSKLRRVRPSLAEVQLVCTAARTENRVHDPALGGLETYETRDLSVETEALRVVALGTSQGTKDDPRYRVYSDRDWPHYSVVVELNGNSTPDSPLYTVGVARRQSGLMEFFGRSSFDNPKNDSIDWKKQVDPECRDERP